MMVMFIILIHDGELLRFFMRLPSPHLHRQPPFVTNIKERSGPVISVCVLTERTSTTEHFNTDIRSQCTN